MGRLTKYGKTSHENGVCCTHFNSKECKEVLGNCAFGCKWEEEVWSKLAEYEDLEESLESAYGECEGFLKTSIEHLVKLADQEEVQEEIGHPHKARLLTDEDADEWLEYKRLKEQGRIVKLPCKVGDVLWCIDNNEIECFVVKEFRICPYKIDRIEIYFEYASGFGLCLFDGTLDEGWFLTKEEAEQALERRKNG